MSLADFYKTGESMASGNTIFIIGRVTSVVYGPYLSDGKTPDPNYNDPTDIGKIQYVIVNSTQFLSSMGDSNPPAKPAWPHLKQLPLQNEFVYIIPGPGLALNDKVGSQDYYYLPPFGLWTSPHHNALPVLNEIVDYASSQKLTYQQSIQGTSNKPDTGSSVYPLARNFPEKADIKMLRPFVGDVTLEGRWGNSIRFGSSVAGNKSENYWSTSNKQGDPIIIIRNGQGKQISSEGWIPAVENINTDNSSIYLTAGQQIAVDDINKNFLLSSFGVNIGVTATTIKELVKVPTSNESLSPQFQDNQTR
jgi:hypothetical protein